MKPKYPGFFPAVFVGFVAFTFHARGANQYWDTNGVTAGSGNATPGTWDAATTNWSTDSTGASATAIWGGAANTAVFAAGTDYTGTNTVNVTGTMALSGLVVESEVSNLTVAGGTLDFGATTGVIDTSAWAATTGKTFTLNSVITGSGGLTIASNGNLTASGGGNSSVTKLGGTNLFTGDVTITSGLVAYASDAAFGNAANVIVLNGGGLLDNNASLTLAHAIKVESGGGTFRLYGSSNSIFSGAITGTGNLNRTDGGTLSLTGDLSGYSGTYDNQSGITVVNGTTAAAGNWKVSGGTLRVGANGLATGGALTLNAGTLSSNSTTGAGDRTLGNAVTIGGNVTLGDGTNTGVLTFTNGVDLGGAARSVTTASAVTMSGAITNGGLVKLGSSSLTLSGANLYAGATTVNAGSLILDYGASDTGKLSDGAALTLGGGTVTLSGGTHLEAVGSTVLTASTASTINRTSGSAQIALGTITRGGGSLLNLGTSGFASAALTNSANGIAGGSWLTVGGTDLATMSGGLITAVTYTDVAFAGVIADAPTSQIRFTGGTTGNITLASTVTNASTLTQYQTTGVTIDTSAKTLRLGAQGSVLVGTGKSSLTIGTASNAGVLTAGGADNTAGVLDFNATGAAITVNSTITDNGSGAVSLSKVGTNELTLTGSNTYSGGTTLSGGALRVRSNSALGSGALTVDGNATLASASGGPYVTVGNAVAISSGTTLALDSGFVPLTLSGAISGAGNLSTTSSGITTLTGTNTYTGTTTIGAGANNIFTGLQLGNGGTAGSTGTGAISFGGTGNNLIYARSNAGAVAPVISGAGSVLVKSGTLSLGTSGVGNTYTGDTVAYGGTLALVGGGFSAGSAVGTGKLYIHSGANVTSSATHIFGGNATTASMAIYGGSYTSAPTSGNEFYIGNIDLAGGTITGGNEFRNGGNRTITVLPSATSSTIDMKYSINGSGTNTATFLVNNGPAVDDLIVSKSITTGTSVVKSGLGTLRSTTSVAHGYTGSTILNAGVFNLDFSASTLTSNMLNAASAPTFAGGNLTITGKASTANTQTLGATTLNAGGSSITLAPGASGTVALTLGAITRNTGATLALTLPVGSTLTANPALTNGVLPYAVVNGNDFGTVTGGAIVANTVYSDDVYSGATINTNVVAVNPAPAAFAVNTLSFRTSQANALTLTGTNTTNALLVGSGVGANATSITGGTLQGTAGGELIIQQFNTNAGGELTIGSTIANNTSATALVKAGGGTLILTGANTYTGINYLNGGITRFTAANNLGTGAITFGGGALQWATGSTVDITSGRTVTIGAGGGTFDTNGNNVTLASALGVSSGTLVKAGAGNLTLTGTNTNFSGSVVVNGGKLIGSINGSSGLGTSQSLIVNSGATLELSGGTNHSTANTRSFYVNGGTLQNTSGVALRMGNIWLNGGTLNTQNGASGSYTAMYLGTLQAGVGGANATVFVEGTSASQITSTGTASHGIQLGPNVVFQVADVTSSAATDLTVSAILQNQSADQGSAAAALTKRGAGTMSISTQATYTGGTFVEQGVLNLLGGGGANGTIRGPVTVSSGATLRLSTGDATGYDSNTRVGVINLMGGNLDVNTTANQTLGSAVVNMTGASITGIAGSNLDFFGGGSALNVNASDITSVIGGVTLSALRQGNTTFTVADGAAAVDLRIDSVIRPSASGDAVGGVLTKAGAGLMQLTGVNTFARNIAITGGTLELAGAGLLGSGNFAQNISNAGSFVSNSTANQTLSGVISGTGTLTKSNSSVLTLSGANTYTGATTVTSGTLLVNGSLANTTVTVQSGGSLGGSGTIGGATTIQSGGILTPGNSPGLISFSNGLALQAGAIVDFQFNGDTLATRGTDYDGIDVINGAFTLGTGVTLNLLASGTNYAAAAWDINRVFKLVDVSGTGTYDSGGSLALNTAGAGAFAGEGSWSATYDSTGVMLNWTAVPEPSVIVLGGLGVLVALRRRRSA